MYARSVVVIGGAASVFMMLGAIWLWMSAGQMAGAWQAASPRVAMWAIRSAAVGAGAAAQLILIELVLNTVWGRDAVGEWLRLLAVLTVVVCSVSAVVLGLAGR